MAIVKMDQFTLMTFHSKKQALLKELQVFGDVHFRSLTPEQFQEEDYLKSDFSAAELTKWETELEKVRFAMAKLRPHAEKQGPTAKRAALSFAEFDRYCAEYDYGSVCDTIKEQDEAIAGYSAEVGRRQAENDTLSAWLSLDAEPDDLNSLTDTGYLIGTVNKQVLDDFVAKMEEKLDTLYIETLDTVKDDVALLLLFPKPAFDEVHNAAREIGFSRATFSFRGIPRQVIEDNKQEIQRLKQAQEEAADAIKAQAGELPKLEIAFDYFSTALERERARQNFLQSETVVLIEGWIPSDEMSKLEAILQSVCGSEYYLELTAVERDNGAVPIKLKNNAFVSFFESITSMYSLPRYNEVDPTPILAPFYWLFFGMMVGDIGYGLVMLIGTSLALKLLDLKPGMKNFIGFFRVLSISVILMGFVYGSAFGVTVFAPIPVMENGVQVGSKAILDSQLDITVMLIVSIIIGIVHLSAGLLTKAFVGFRNGDFATGMFDGIFWLIAMLSGIGWLVGMIGVLPDPTGTVCKYVFLASLIGLAATQGRSSPSIGGKIGNGLYGVYGITSYVGDVVSYTRIVALALSGAYIAYAFNIMTGLVVGEFGSGGMVASLLRLLFGIIIVVFGQTLNLGLALLGAYVHSCRLQYVEFFGKFYDGGGVVFRPLTLKTDHIHITK